LKAWSSLSITPYTDLVTFPVEASAGQFLPIVRPLTDHRIDPIEQPQAVAGKTVIGSGALLSQEVAARQRDARCPRCVLRGIVAGRLSGAQPDCDRDDRSKRLE
jgi:hypothetical protein